MAETEISTLGEFGLIEHLTENMPPVNTSTEIGVGDDAAVLSYGEKKTLVTTDLLLEGIHFDLRYVALKHLGYKAAVVNFSDIYAMNGTPKQITVSLGISKRFTVEHIEALYAGIRLACEKYGVDIVSGDLGAAYMGLQLLERELNVSKDMGNDFQPAFEGREYLLERQLKPEARRDVIAELAELGVKPTAMMDVSDGLSSELLHICKASNTGCRIYEDRIPIDYQTAVMAEEFNMNLYTVALNGGEDYELLFTVPLADYDKVASMKSARVIGRITKPELGCYMSTRDDNEIELVAQGWNAFKE